MPTWEDQREVPNVRANGNVRSLKSEAIQSQYSASKTMLELMASFQGQLEISGEVDLFHEKIFNIYTAEGPGLDNWGRIIGVARTIEDGKVSITLDDEHYRLLLLYKALANISRSDLATLNGLLHQLINLGIGNFPRLAYVIEVDTMVIRWVFEDWLTDIEKAIFKTAGTLARGAGVGWELYAVNPEQVFGFDQSEMHPFNQRPFAPDRALISN